VSGEVGEHFGQWKERTTRREGTSICVQIRTKKKLGRWKKDVGAVKEREKSRARGSRINSNQKKVEQGDRIRKKKPRRRRKKIGKLTRDAVNKERRNYLQ